MTHDSRPPRRGLLPNLSPKFTNHIARVEYSVFTIVDPALAWKIFSNVALWNKFCPLYGNLRWQGTPWTPGSRLKIDLGDPINAVLDRVVTVCIPPSHLGWINHVRGFTMEQWILLEPGLGGGTHVSTWIELTGAEHSAQRDEAIAYLRTVVTTWFDNFRAECDRTAHNHADDIPAAPD